MGSGNFQHVALSAAHAATRTARRWRAPGFTLLELMMTLAVAAILLMIAAPSFRHLLTSTNLSGINNDLNGDIQFARTQAVTRQVNIAVAASSGKWQNGWNVEVASSSSVLRTHSAVPAKYVVNGGTTTEVTFQPQGSLAPASGSTAPPNACITISATGFDSSRFLQVLAAGMVQQTTSSTAPTGCPTPTP